MIGIGIDTGGTYTDAVLYDTETREVLDKGKTLTTRDDLKRGILAALDMMDQELLKKAKMIALSTTLATNAALENTGSRAKCLMIGMHQDIMRDPQKTYASYGLSDFSQLVFIPGKPENVYENPEEPDWEELRKKAPEWFAGCESVGVTQILSYADGGKLEKKASRILSDLGYQVTTAYDIFDEPDVLKQGAGTLLNARLVPIIRDFVASVRKALKERDLDRPVAIVRSDGALMSEAMAMIRPVEMLVSGPAASAVGGSVLADAPDAMIVDMGGTTTDIALVRGGHPVQAEKGIAIGPWDTAVQGLYVDTFLLGGDSAVRVADEKLFLDGKRVIPLSQLQKQHPEIISKLRELADSEKKHTRMLHEFFLLQREPSRDADYTDQEWEVIEALRNGPLIMQEFAEATGRDVYRLKTERLESEGVVIRSGLTPTDMMAVKEDFPALDPAAAKEALRFLSRNVAEKPEEIPDAVYRLVVKKMYCNIVRILMEQKYKKNRRIVRQESISRMVEWSFDEAYEGKKPEWLSFLIRTDLPLLGVGAPIHIFLPKVASLLGTGYVICPNAPVANAIGAIASKIVTNITAHIRAEYDRGVLEGYSCMFDTKKVLFKEYEDAEREARRLVREQVLEKAKLQGAGDNPDIKVSVRAVRSDTGKSSMFFESIVEATATDVFLL